MVPKKRLKSTVASTNRAQAARGNFSLPHVVNKYNIAFLDTNHAPHYDVIITRKIRAPSYLDEQMLTALQLFDDLKILLSRLSWVHFVSLQEPVYEWLI